MRKIAMLILCIGFTALFATLALRADASDPVDWDVRGTYTIAFNCTSGCGGTWNHSMEVTVENMDTGVFSGTGYFINNTAYTWVVNGAVSGNDISFDVDYTGLNPSYYVNAQGTIAVNGSMSGTATAPGQTFDWATTSGYAKFNRRAEITSPTEGDTVAGVVSFDAILNDEMHDDNVQWAVREGTCAAATNTVLGNVDGHNDSFAWDGISFHAEADTLSWIAGDYCFVFNPTESTGDLPIRLTRWFVVEDQIAPTIVLEEPLDGSTHSGVMHLRATCNEECDYVNFWWRAEDQSYDPVDKQYHYVHTNGTIFEWDLDTLNPELWGGDIGSMPDGNYYLYAAGKDLAGNWARTQEVMVIVHNDSDGDGVVDSIDLCLDTTVDNPERGLGTNRWMWDDNKWFTHDPKGRGPEKDYTIEDTMGCSCKQILDSMKKSIEFEFGGHYKFGCSSSILDDWMSGYYHVDSVEVPADATGAVETEYVLKSSESYKLVASGVANAGDTIDFDAKYSITNRISGDGWTDEVSGYNSYGPTLLDLFVEGSSVDWGAYNEDHIYEYEMPGVDTPVSFLVYDIYPINNVGSLNVDVFVELW